MTYYEYQRSLFEQNLTIDEVDRLLLEKLEETLNKRDEEANWLADHYYSAAEALFDDPHDEKLVRLAESEIKIFEAAGYSAECMKKWLLEAKSNARE